MSSDKTSLSGSPSSAEFSADCWEQVVQELHACKQHQLQAWGEIDNIVLGRYLAGEASLEESRQIEQSLDSLPELRKLTSLVQDVLGETAPVAEPIQTSSPEPLPRILSFADSSLKFHHRRSISRFLRRYGSLVASACIFLALGFSLPMNGRTVPTEQDSLTLPVGMASTRPVMFASAQKGLDSSDSLLSSWNANGTALTTWTPRNQVDRAAPVAMIVGAEPAPVQIAEKVSRTNTVTPREAVNCQRMGNRYMARGEFVRAEEPLARAAEYCTNRFGLHHPATKASVRDLADLYATALTAPAKKMMVRGNPNIKSLTAPAPNPVSMDQRQKLMHSQKLQTDIMTQPICVIRTSVIPVLVEGIKLAPSGEDRILLVRALGQLGPASCVAMPTLLEQLVRTEDVSQAQVVIQTLEEIGPAARLTVPFLRVITGQERVQLRREPSRLVALRKQFTFSDERKQLTTQLLKHLEGPLGSIGIRDSVGCFTVQAAKIAQLHFHQLAQQKKYIVRLSTSAAPLPPMTAPCDMCSRFPNAVVIRIDTVTPAVQVRTGEQLQQDGFPTAKLRDTLLMPIKENQYDLALSQGIRFLQKNPDASKR